MKQRFKQPVIIAATLVLTPILYLLFIYAFFSVLFSEPKKSFSKKHWDAVPFERYMMIDDLIQKKLLIGKDSDYVKTVIGPPDGSYTDSLSRTTWNYHVGMGSGGLGFLYHGMQVTFQSKTVIHVEHFSVRD